MNREELEKRYDEALEKMKEKKDQYINELLESEKIVNTSGGSLKVLLDDNTTVFQVSVKLSLYPSILEEKQCTE